MEARVFVCKCVSSVQNRTEKASQLRGETSSSESPVAYNTSLRITMM